ncbi:hypothetical protein PanWU01x14_038180, partial [Parasponia andersonii]
MQGQNIMVKISRDVRYWNSIDKELRLLQFSMDKDRSLLKPLFPPSGKDVKLSQSPISKDSRALRYCKLCGKYLSSPHQRITNVFKAVRFPKSAGKNESPWQDFIARFLRRGLLIGNA